MADVIKEFLVSLGFSVDTSSQRKFEEASIGAEKRITAAHEGETNKRAASDKVATNRRATTAQQLAQLLTAMEQDRADRAEAVRKAETAAGEKRDAETLRRATERRDALVKSTRGLIVSMAALPAALAVGVTAAATGLLWATDRAAKGFERLYYTAANSGSSAAGLTKFEYAASRLGTTAEDARASVAAFGENLKNIPALEGVLKNMGIRTREANGELRDTAELTKEYIDHLKALPQLQREAQTSAWGISNATTRAAIRPEFGAFEDEQDRINKIVGADPNKAAAGGAAFESAMKRVEAILGALGTRIETNLFDTIKPRIDAVADWVLAHGDTITNFVNTTAKGLTDLGTAFANSQVVKDAINGLSGGLENAAKYIASDQFRKDVQTFVDDVQSLAHAIRTALEWIGVLPDRNASPSKAAINGGRPDVGPRDNDLGLPGIDSATPSDSATAAARADAMGKATEDTATGFWGWVKAKAKDYGWGDRLPGGAEDKRVRDAILSTAADTKRLADAKDGPEAGGGDAGGGGGALGAANRLLGWAGRALGGGRGSGYAPGHFAGFGNGGWEKAGASKQEVADYIRHQAASMGIDPDVAVRVAQSEGLGTYTGDHGTSFGPYQLHYGGSGIPGMNSSGLGDAFTRETGKDARDPTTWKAQVDFALKKAKEGGWSPWHGAAHVGIGNRQGFDYHGPVPAAPSAPTAPTASPGGPSAAAIGDAAVQAARLRIINGSHDPKDREIVRRYLEQQNIPKVHTSFAVPPSGITPSLQASYNNSHTRGDTNITHNPTFNITGGDIKSSLDSARMVADRGTKDLVRNLRAVEV